MDGLPQMCNFVPPASKTPGRRVHTQQQSRWLRYMAAAGPLFPQAPEKNSNSPSKENKYILITLCTLHIFTSLTYCTGTVQMCSAAPAPAKNTA